MNNSNDCLQIFLTSFIHFNANISELTCLAAGHVLSAKTIVVTKQIKLWTSQCVRYMWAML